MATNPYSQPKVPGSAGAAVGGPNWQDWISSQTTPPTIAGLKVRGGTFDPSTGAAKYTYGQDPTDYLRQFQSDINGALNSGGAQPFDVSGGGAATGRVPANVAPVTRDAGAEDAARRATFARTKDQVGQESRGALNSLRSTLGDRGMLGGAAESQGVKGIVQTGQGELGNVSREQAIQDSSNIQHVADINQQAGVAQRGQDVTQRGQNISAQESARQFNIQVRQQQFQQQQAIQEMRVKALLGLMSATGAYY